MPDSINQNSPCPQCHRGHIEKFRCSCNAVACYVCGYICAKCGSIRCPSCYRAAMMRNKNVFICTDCQLDAVIENSKEFLRDIGVRDD